MEWKGECSGVKGGEEWSKVEVGSRVEGDEWSGVKGGEEWSREYIGCREWSGVE